MHNARIEYAGGAYLDGCMEVTDAKVLLDAVTITNCIDYGLQLNGTGALATGSGGLTITHNSLAGVQVQADQAGSLPGSGCDYSANTSAGVEIAGGTMTTSATWKKINVPYFISGEIYVEGAATPKLTIEAGAHLEFGADKGIYVAYNGGAGGLWAVGDGTGPIVFTAHAASPSAGHWSGIEFRGNTNDATSNLSYVTIEYAGGAYLGADLVITDAQPTLANLTLRGSQEYGLELNCANAMTFNLASVTYDANTSGPVLADALCAH